MTVNRRYGANDLRIDYTRKLGATRGYANRLGPQFVPAPSLGSLVLDLNGKPIGFFSRRRRPKEELEPYEQTQSAQLPGSQRTSSAELFALADWASALTDPASYVDPQVVRLDEKQEGRRAWLGVEFSPLTKDLAESLGCRRESKDGRLGLMISQIYAGSPAEQVGLRTGDVILGVDVPGRPRTIDLAPGRRGSSTPDLSQLMSQGDGARSASSRAPWPSQENYLTTLLDIVGADTTVKLSVWRGGKLEHIETRVTQAPPDQDSAEQFKDEEIGLTVKEVTYEVRAALRLKPDDPGVVVARVESGAPAGRARINAFEIIQSADGEPINSPAEFGEIINKARAEKKDQVRLVVVDRGRSRFADLKMGQ